MVKTRCSHILESKIKHIFDRVSFLSLYCLISPSVFRTGNIKGKRRIWNLSEASFFLFPLSNQPPSFHIPNSLSLCKKPFFSTEGKGGKEGFASWNSGGCQEKCRWKFHQNISPFWHGQESDCTFKKIIFFSFWWISHRDWLSSRMGRLLRRAAFSVRTLQPASQGKKQSPKTSPKTASFSKKVFYGTFITCAPPQKMSACSHKHVVYRRRGKLEVTSGV